MRTTFAIACTLLAAAKASAAPVDFARDVRPILSVQCYQCHGPDDATRKAKLRLDVREDALKNGAIVPGKPDESELLNRLHTADADKVMPPPKAKKPPITDAQRATLKQWISEGAKYSDHWSFTKLARPEVPKPTDAAWGKNAIDAFVRYRLEQAGLKPSAEADKVTLIRRLYFDLTGLPPTPDAVKAFVNDPAPNAYEKVVDALLASPQYGERMAVWWLDLVRYADSIGYHSDNPMNVWLFRDYVIRAFNDTVPFDRFTTEQLAGDLIPNNTKWQRIASAYNRLLQTTEEGGGQAKEYIAKYSADRVRNYGQVWLGGTLMCAECHNHKFDPYSQADFYSVAAFFADIQEPSVGGRGPGTGFALTAEQEATQRKLNRAAAIAQARLDAASHALADFEDAFADAEKWPNPAPGKKGPATVAVPADVKAMLAKEKRTPAEVARLAAFARDSAPELKADRDALAAATKARTDFENTLPKVLIAQSGAPRTVRILPRGDWLNETGPIVTPNVPGFLPPLPPLPKGQARYTRLDLAKWTVAPENPLTARVTANRLWRLFFGTGIARSLEESGTQGELPTHPELLDYLATEFAAKWDVKALVKLMVTSAAYRQSSLETPAMRERDPLNKLFARQARQRLDAEFVRDTALSVSGLLNQQVGGPSVKPYQPPGYWAALNFPTREWQKDAAPATYRRGMYTHWQRSFLHPAMAALDAPSREECTCDRPRSNIPQQALVLLNDPVFVEAAKALASKVLASGAKDDGAKVAFAFERATGRAPNADESKILLGLLAKHRKQFAEKPDDAKKLLSVGDVPAPKDVKAEELAAWVSVCRTVLNLHETITRQ
jgi:hypothetical protein